MVFKRPRIDDSDSPDYDFNVASSLGDKINQFISSNISEIEANVREALALKVKEISEKDGIYSGCEGELQTYGGECP